MRVLVLGGTRFIGRAIVDELLAAGHDVTAVHRGETEPDGLPAIEHLHLARRDWPAHAEAFAAARPDAVVDCLAMTRGDVGNALAVLPAGADVVVLSSQDIYRAFSSLQAGTDTDAVPIDEGSPIRVDRYPHRGRGTEFEMYSKQEVEEEYAARGAVVLRLPATYGEHDRQRREEFILRRVRAGRVRIPIGAGGLVWTRAYVRDIARGVRLAAESREVAGEVFNLGEERSWSMRLYAQRILDAAECGAELVTVPDDALPEDMGLTGAAMTQHVLTSSARARALLGYSDTDAMEALRASVRWHLEHPPEAAGEGFDADDAALARVEEVGGGSG